MERMDQSERPLVLTEPGHQGPGGLNKLATILAIAHWPSQHALPDDEGLETVVSKHQRGWKLVSKHQTHHFQVPLAEGPKAVVQSLRLYVSVIA